MKQPTRAELEAYVRRWAELAPILDQLREADIRNADTAASIRAFDTAFKIALRDLPPRESSGLVEWQDMARRWFERG
jgi:hypothetical protein